MVLRSVRGEAKPNDRARGPARPGPAGRRAARGAFSRRAYAHARVGGEPRPADRDSVEGRLCATIPSSVHHVVIRHSVSVTTHQRALCAGIGHCLPENVRHCECNVQQRIGKKQLPSRLLDTTTHTPTSVLRGQTLFNTHHHCTSVGCARPTPTLTARPVPHGTLPSAPPIPRPPSPSPQAPPPVPPPPSPPPPSDLALAATIVAVGTADPSCASP